MSTITIPDFFNYVNSIIFISSIPAKNCLGFELEINLQEEDKSDLKCKCLEKVKANTLINVLHIWGCT